MYDIVGIGLALVDIVLTIDSFPVKDGCAYILSEEKFIGGCTANLLISASKLGLKTALLTRIGDDDVGRFILEKLNDFKIDVCSVKIGQEFSGKVYVVVDKDNERRFFSMLPQSAISKFNINDLDPNAIRRGRVVFGDGAMYFDNEPAQAVLEAMKIAKNAGITVAFDPNLRISKRNLPLQLKEIIYETLKFTDILLLNEDEAKMLTGEEGFVNTLRRLKDTGVSIIALKLGSKGCVIISGKDIIYCPAFNLKVVDSVGAGDAFNAGFIYGYLKGWHAAKIGVFANAVGGLKVTRKGASSSPTLPEVENLIKSQPVQVKRLDLD